MRIWITGIAVMALVAAGCGDNSDDEAGEERSVTPEQALAEITEVRRGLEGAMVAYRAGDADDAKRLAEDAYLEHFELVEGPLEEADAELNEKLEETIREELVAEISSGAPASQIEGLIEEIDSGLDEAERAVSAEG